MVQGLHLSICVPGSVFFCHLELPSHSLLCHLCFQMGNLEKDTVWRLSHCQAPGLSSLVHVHGQRWGSAVLQP
jgi:hypothetical protein